MEVKTSDDIRVLTRPLLAVAAALVALMAPVVAHASDGAAGVSRGVWMHELARMPGSVDERYGYWHRDHAQAFGWTGWARGGQCIPMEITSGNGASARTAGAPLLFAAGNERS